MHAFTRFCIYVDHLKCYVLGEGSGFQPGKLLRGLKIFGADLGLWQENNGDKEGRFLAEKHLWVCFRERLRDL